MTGERKQTTAEQGDFPPEPRLNPDLVGHEGAENILRSSFESGRLPHAWLITGPRGIGKATFAKMKDRITVEATENKRQKRQQE